MSVQHITDAQTALGIELGSTRIKAVLIGPDHEVLATGSHQWENQLVDGYWTYDLDTAVKGLQAAYADLVKDVQDKYDVTPTTYGAIGISGMMHGYLPFDRDGKQLAAFRTWRNVNAAVAADELTQALEINIPMRWSVAHLYQAVLDSEEHVARVDHITTLAGYIHWQLTGEKCIGIGEASGMFPIDSTTGTYDAKRLEAFDELAQKHGVTWRLKDLLPRVLSATPATESCGVTPGETCGGSEGFAEAYAVGGLKGIGISQSAGSLTEAGAKLLDPTGTLQAGIPMCPPEGDAGTGMIATNAIAPRTGNISAGTSIFAMFVLEKDLSKLHVEVDPVCTPDGSPVAMVHSNNGSSELDAWVGLFRQFASAVGIEVTASQAFEAAYRAALGGEVDGGGVLTYNLLAGEPIVGVDEGRPVTVRTPGSSLDLGTFMRAQLLTAFAPIRVGMDILRAEGVAVDSLFGHGGFFSTPGVSQQIFADMLDIPVAVGETAAEGGAWGIAVLARYSVANNGQMLPEYLAEKVFAGGNTSTLKPVPAQVEGAQKYLARYRAGLDIVRTAASI